MSTPVISRRFTVTSGSCLDCSGDIPATISAVPGVLSVDVLTVAGVIVVHHDGHVGDEAIIAAGERLGLGLATDIGRPVAPSDPWWRKRRVQATSVAGLLFIVGLIADVVGAPGWLSGGLYLAAVVVGGVFPVLSAYSALRSPARVSISTLLVVAGIGALALGLYEETALLMVVFSLGEMLEEYASDRAQRSISGLLSLVPPVAHRVDETGNVQVVPVEQLALGDLVLVRPGERLPTDGTVTSGRSAVDQSPITGESVPVDAGPGSDVYGGTVNGSGALQVEVTQQWQDTVLSRVVRQVQDAQASRGQAQRFADRFGAVYTPAMFALALLVAVVPPLLGGDPREWVYRALVVLVVSCSCALVLSVPVAVVAAITRAARDGVLIKGGVHLEQLARVQFLAIDKTGTLTRGRPQVTAVEPVAGQDSDELLALAAAVESVSGHPLAAAILAAAAARRLRVPVATQGRATPGRGVSARVGGRELFVGRPTEPNLPGELAQVLARLEAAGNTVVAVTDTARVLGLIAVADELRPEAAEVVAQLRRLGVADVILLTGDNDRVAAAIAKRAGITSWQAGLMPEDKTTAILRLRQRGVVGMVGDGINDAPALATADVGIAMGAAGTDVALETADIALMADSLSALPGALRLARRAARNLRQNITLSLITVAVLVLGALTGRLHLASGLLLNEGIAVLIILNGLRLLRPSPTAIRRHTAVE